MHPAFELINDSEGVERFANLSSPCYVIEEEQFSKETLEQAVTYVFENKQTYVETMKKNTEEDSIEMIIDLLKAVAK